MVRRGLIGAPVITDEQETLVKAKLRQLTPEGLESFDRRAEEAKDALSFFSGQWLGPAGVNIPELESQADRVALLLRDLLQIAEAVRIEERSGTTRRDDSVFGFGFVKRQRR